ncbi:centromere protein F [Diachasma alloeum]|uniref:centromere protein F n=1 Tax=Diachasma alloeum TaxID=454923 RepID=UPI000738289A|nr:centromere protein F [Diachasma alloeum]
MSYAEYGARIFMPVNLKTEKFLVRDDEIAQVKSGHRLKMYDSFLDIRTWSPKQLETFQYFRDVTENQNEGKIVPIDYLIEIINDLSTHSEVLMLREELERYKSLELTPEQERQLQQKMRNEGFIDHRHMEITEDNKFEVEELEDENDETLVSEASDMTIPYNSNLNSYSHFTSTESLTPESKTYDSDVTSKVLSNSSTIDEQVTFSNRSCDSRGLESPTGSIDSEHTRIIKNESMIISLENALGVKKAEIEELKEKMRNLLGELKEREAKNKNLQDHLRSMQRQLEMMTERNSAIEEYKKIANGKNLIDQLKTKLDEKRDQCLELSKEINKLRQRENNDQVRAERDDLNNKLKEFLRSLKSFGVEPSEKGMEKILRERKELIESEKNWHLQCLDHEEEIAKLSHLIDRMCNKHQERENELKQIIENLKIESRSKNKKLDEYKDKMSSMLKGFEDKILHEKSMADRNVEDENIDRALSFYLRKSVDKFNEFSEAFECLRSGGGDSPGPRRDEIEQLKNELMEPMQELKNQIVKRTNEANLYLNRYEECQRIIEIQSEELRQLREIQHKFHENSSIVEELKKSKSKMELKFIELHKEHYNLTNTIHNLTSELALKNEQIINLETERDSLSCRLTSSAIELKSKDEKLNSLKRENSEIEGKLKEAEENAAKVQSEIKDLKHESDILNQLAFLQKEITKYGREKKKLEENISQLREEFNTCRTSNQTLNESLNDRVKERESLQDKIATMKQNISNLANELTFNNFDKRNVMSLPVKLCESIEVLKKRLQGSSSGSDDTRQNNNDSLENDVEEYQSQLFGSCNEGAKILRKSEIFFKRNLQIVDGSKDELHKVHFEGVNEGVKGVHQEKEQLSSGTNNGKIVMLDNTPEILQRDYKNFEGSYEGVRSAKESEGQYYVTIPASTKPRISSFIERNVPQKIELFVKPETMNSDPPKVSVFRNPQPFLPDMKNPMNVHNMRAPFYDSNPMSRRYLRHLSGEAVKRFEIDASNKNFITACSARRKNDN